MAKISIPTNLKETQEQRPVPLGVYDLTVASAEIVKAKSSGNDQLKISIGIDGHDGAPNVTHFASFPQPGDDPQKAGFKALQLRRFLEAFNIPYEVNGDGTEFDTDDFPGAKARMALGLDKPENSDEEYNRLKLPKIRDEAPGRGNGGGRRLSPPKR